MCAILQNPSIARNHNASVLPPSNPLPALPAVSSTVQHATNTQSIVPVVKPVSIHQPGTSRYPLKAIQSGLPNSQVTNHLSNLSQNQHASESHVAGPFAGATITGGTFHLRFSNSSDSTAIYHSPPKQKYPVYKRLRPVIESDSDNNFN